MFPFQRTVSQEFHLDGRERKINRSGRNKSLSMIYKAAVSYVFELGDVTGYVEEYSFILRI